MSLRIDLIDRMGYLAVYVKSEFWLFGLVALAAGLDDLELGLLVKRLSVWT
jgi:hypothetical protein